MKKKLLAGLMVTAMIASLCACDKKTDETKTEDETEATTTAVETEAPAETEPTETEPEETGLTQEMYDSMTKEDLLEMANIADIENLTMDEFQWIVETYRFVPINYEDMTWKTSETPTGELLKDLSKAKPSQSEYLPILLKSDIPQVRAFCYPQITSLFGVSEADLDNAMEAVANETDEFCLMQAAAALSNEMAKDPRVAEFEFAMSHHENYMIRNKAAIAIGNPWSIGVDGCVERIIEMMNDENENVRKLALNGAGRLDDESVIDPIVEVLNDPERASEHGEAIRGLAWLWYDYPSHEHTSEKAYQATLNYLKQTPRSETLPAWNAISVFSTVNDDKIGEWYTNATYFSQDEWFNVMADLIKDPEFNWLGKTPAMKSIAGLCPDKFGDLEGVMASVEDDKVIESYESLKEEIAGKADA